MIDGYLAVPGIENALEALGQKKTYNPTYPHKNAILPNLSPEAESAVLYTIGEHNDAIAQLEVIK